MMLRGESDWPLSDRPSRYQAGAAGGRGPNLNEDQCVKSTMLRGESASHTSASSLAGQPRRHSPLSDRPGTPSPRPKRWRLGS